jgi:hypothetical protein
MLFSLARNDARFFGCLYSVAGDAQGLMIGRVPEEFIVTSVWSDMINDLGWNDSFFFFTLNTERMLL